MKASESMPPPPPRIMRPATPALDSSLSPESKRGADLSPQSPGTSTYARTWESYFERRTQVVIKGRGMFQVYQKGHRGPVVVCLHGGGHTGLTWACMTAKLPTDTTCRVLAMDLRGHGGSLANDEKDYSMASLVGDVVGVVEAVFPGGGDVPPPPLVLVGHSMGGALAVHVAAANRLPTLAALVVIDVVEGTAMESLPHMKDVLKSRQQHFASVREALSWAEGVGLTKNQEAAGVSIPSQLTPAPLPFPGLTWRTQLEDTCPFWNEWFQNLSATFLSAKVPKLLILAGTDRLDTPLNIAQMQGKFQLALIPSAGHIIQEDEPEMTSDAIVKFLKCFRVGQSSDLVDLANSALS